MSEYRVFLISVTILLALSCGGRTDCRPNIVLLLIDTVNADHLGSYGYHRNTSPAIDSLAETGIRFARCQAQAPWTLPGMTTILTGLTEKSHGCNRYNGFSHGLDPDIPTLATILQAEGYTTATFFNIGYLGSEYGLNRGYDTCWMGTDLIDYAEETVDTVMSYLGNSLTDKPFFLTVHLFDAHLPYDPPAPFDTLFNGVGTAGMTDWPARSLCSDPTVIRHMTDLYDSELRWTDSQLERLFSYLRSENLSENTIIILVADHGEEFMEHGDWGHAHNLYQQSLHVPLIISGPGIQAGSVVSSYVGQFDVLPTLLDYLSVPAPDHAEGISLLGEIPENRILPSSGVLADTVSACCIKNSAKVLWFIEPDSTETYDLVSDPGETTPLPLDSLLFEEVLRYWAWPCICTPTSYEDDEIELKRLQDLGYIR